jgi:hypothetical protein
MSVPADSSGTQAKSTTWRTALFVFIGSSTLWLGSVYSRAIIGNDLLKFGTLTFEEYIAPDAEREIFRLLSLISLSVIGSYLIALFSSIVFLVTCPFKLKEHGWLMICAIHFYLFVPAETFTMYLDWRMIYTEFFTTADNQVFRELFVARIGALAGTPFISTLCYYTIMALAVFQPLQKRLPQST